MVDKGHEYFNLMQQRYKIEPNVKHYGCMVDMLSRAGLLKEAFEFIGTMKIEPNPIIWRRPFLGLVGSMVRSNWLNMRIGNF